MEKLFLQKKYLTFVQLPGCKYENDYSSRVINIDIKIYVNCQEWKNFET